jgi:hypothetical protein
MSRSAARKIDKIRGQLLRIPPALRGLLGDNAGKRHPPKGTPRMVVRAFEQQLRALQSIPLLPCSAMFVVGTRNRSMVTIPRGCRGILHGEGLGPQV